MLARTGEDLGGETQHLVAPHSFGRCTVHQRHRKRLGRIESPIGDSVDFAQPLQEIRRDAHSNGTLDSLFHLELETGSASGSVPITSSLSTERRFRSSTISRSQSGTSMVQRHPVK